jgi:hypothetical protein
METIVLKNKKRIDWKKVIIILILCAMIAGSAILVYHCRLSYQYYTIDITGIKTVLGNSTQSNLVDRAFEEKLREVKQEGYQIADFNASSLIKKKVVITKRSNKNDDTSIKTQIKQDIYVVVPAYKLTIDKNTYYFQRSLGYNTLYKLKEINKQLNITMLEGEFVNKDLIMTQEEADQLINNYSKINKK